MDFFCFTYQVSMVCYPVCHYPCRTILEDAARHILRGRIGEGFSWTLHIILTLVICGFALGTSLLTSNLGSVSAFHFAYPGVCLSFRYLETLLVGFVPRAESFLSKSKHLNLLKEETDFGLLNICGGSLWWCWSVRRILCHLTHSTMYPVI